MLLQDRSHDSLKAQYALGNRSMNKRVVDLIDQQRTP
jgi:hypothetical protein